MPSEVVCVSVSAVSALALSRYSVLASTIFGLLKVLCHNLNYNFPFEILALIVIWSTSGMSLEVDPLF